MVAQKGTVLSGVFVIEALPRIRAVAFAAGVLALLAWMTAPRPLSAYPAPLWIAQTIPQTLPQDTTRLRMMGLLPDTTGQGKRMSDSLAARTKDSVAASIARADSLRRKLIIDTTYVVYMDSSARLRQFRPVRRERPQVSLFPRRTYPLFGTPKSTNLRRELSLDSTGTNVLIRERYGGTDVRIPVTVPLDSFIVLSQANAFRNVIAVSAHEVKALAQKDDLGSLLSNITQITIPVPANPLFSVFGKNEIRLTISGAVDIKAGFRNTKSDQMTISRLDQSRNEPDFSQEVQVTVNGTIGDKLNILADWNTRRTFEYENQLKIKYTGYEDEIVQSVEAGNVSLSTPSSFIGSSQALFGVKAKFQAGPLTLTALASQKKGQIKEVAVSGGSKEQTFEFRAYEYATNHFFIDTTYRKYYETYYNTEPAQVDPAVQIVEEEVWVTRQGGIPDPKEQQAVAFITLPPIGSGYNESLRDLADPPGVIETGPFIKLDRSQYELDGDGYLGVLSLNVNVGDQQIVAIAYRTAAGVQVGEFYRDLPSDSTLTKKLILKMVKPKNLLATGPVFKIAWNQLLKNIYPIPGIGRNLKRQGFSLDLFRRIPGLEDQNSINNEPLLRVMELDRFNSDDTPAPTGDGQFDFRAGRTINLNRAEIIFPRLRPFDNGISRYFSDKGTPLPDTSEFYYPEIYDTTQTFAQQSLRNRYIVRGKATGEATSKYSLGFNVVEGSVQVLLDGSTLVQNVDYTVDYIIGEVVIKNERALVPGANLQIKYEQNDLFQLASKTLLGARGDLALSKNTNLGFTIMNLNQQTLSDRVRLGEEPNENTIFGVDGSTSLELPFLTRALDALPLIQTREPSSFKVSGEAAYMLPDPNTKKSTIVSDNGEGIAYIDDFEGARRSIPIGIAYNSWTQSSPPGDSVHFFNVPDTTKMYSKGRMIWFNRLPTDVTIEEVYYNKYAPKGQNQVTVLDLEYFPLVRGQFNYGVDLENTLRRDRNWAGVMRPLSISAVNLTRENVNFVELWMRIDKVPGDRSGKLLIDLGSVSEDVIPNRILNSEDLVISSSPNGTLQEGEDVGIDMLTDAQEQSRYAAMIARYPEMSGDPSGDNYAFNNATVGTFQEDYTRINGTENNKDGPGGRIPDSEDLNSNGVVDLSNSFFQYELPLDDNPLTNPRIVGGNPEYRWYQFRIPIKEYSRTVGSPTFENIEYVRLSFVNATDTIHVRIAEMSLVGNQWQKLIRGQDDTSFAVSVVNAEENPLYTLPPGVSRPPDRTRPEDNVLLNEQSLALLLKGVPDGESRQAVKYYTYKALDLFDYRTMKMYIHSDPAFTYTSPVDYDAEVFFRFGLDSLNFYEYRAPLVYNQEAGTDGWSEMTVMFSDLTAIKQGRDSVNIISPSLPVPNGPPGAIYRVLGNPSLTQIVYMSVGVENPRGKGTTQPLVGNVWFDELRLTSVDDTPGWAYRFETSVKLADVANVSLNYSRTDPYFHSLEARFGSRQNSTNWGLSANIQVEKIFPDSWAGTSIPFSYSHTEGFVAPRYLPNSDIAVSKAAELQREKVVSKGGTAEQADSAANTITLDSQTKRTSDTYAAPNFRIALPSDHWLVRDTFNKLTFGFTYNEAYEKNPSTVYRSAWSWNARVGYGITLPPDYYFQPFTSILKGLWFLDEYKDLKIFFPISDFNWSLAAVRSRDNSLQRSLGAREIISRNFTASRQMGFRWKLTEGGLMNFSGDYSVNIESSLLYLETDEQGNQRPFSAIMDDVFGSGSINFGQDIRYGQRVQFNSKPNIPNLLGIKKFVDISFNYGADYGWNNSLTKGDLGKSAMASGNVTASANVRLKQIFDPLWGDGAPAAPAQVPAQRGRRSGEGETASLADTARVDSVKGIGALEKLFAQIGMLTRVLIKVPFLDYDNVSLTFTQQNSMQNNGVVGRPGFVNFWAFFQGQDPQYGPSRLYQLGLISDPSGKLTNFHFKKTPPFFGWDLEPGIRAPGGTLVNVYRQTNRFSIRTNRSLWEGARLELNWSVGWAYNRTQNVQTLDTSQASVPTVLNTTTSGNLDRSYMAFPDAFPFKFFKTGLTQVSEKYTELKADKSDTRPDEEKLAQAFEEGFEALPFFRNIFGPYTPRVNWSLRWDGLEKIPLFANFATRVSLDHAYTSAFARQYQNRPGGGGERTDGERVSYGFAPLAGLNFTFKELGKGNLGATMRLNTNTAYDLATSSRNIVEVSTSELSITASYSRRGFEIPFFGLSLNNDIDISASYSVARNSRKSYEISKLETNAPGTPLEGNTRTTLEPRIRYVLSSRVNASVYYRYTKIAPDDFGSRIPGTTTNEAGLDIHIAIQ